MADMKTFLDNEIAKLTEEEVEAEYKRLVEAEDRSVMQIKRFKFWYLTLLNHMNTVFFIQIHGEFPLHVLGPSM